MRMKKGFATVFMVLVCLVMTTSASHNVYAQSVRERLRSIISRQSEVRERLREVKRRQSEAVSELTRARRQEQEARDRARAARRRLEEVRAILRKVKADLAQTEEELKGHREAMSRRLVALYEAGQPSYLEVVLNATSFEDFTNRAEFSRLIARRDQQLLTTLVETEERLRTQRAELEAREREAAELRTEAERQERLAAQRTAEAAAIAARLQKDRATYEREMAALEAAERELEALVRARASSSSGGGYQGTSTGRYPLPVNGRITSPYGWRIHPIWHTRRFHTGVDIAAPTGTPIRACDDGKVIFAGWRGATGKTVIIDHGSGWATSYGHCSRIYVRPGQIVEKGQTIAAVGSTGVSTGPHVHWMVYRNGRHVNPLRP